ncbi:MAG: hypothetical protein ABJF01_04070 [bacterium]
MAGSLSSARGYVTNAFSLAMATPFVPENIVFGHFTFVPWVRTGLGAAQESPGSDPVRATVRVQLTVTDDGPATEVVERTLILRGPGDVVGLDPGQIIRRFPANGTIDAEESLLAHIEFDRPELPWLFSPAASVGDQIAPWLALVVCDATVSTEEPGPPGLPRQLRTRLGELQSLGDSWAWAHAQIHGTGAGSPTVAERLSASYGPVNLSRLMCPRKLDQGKHYIAALVPAFECGRLSALGDHGGTLDPAWTRAADESDADVEIVLPMFDSWSFAVAPSGDFEQLAGRLHGVTAPWNVGRRVIDATEPRGNVTDLAAGDQGSMQVVRCALVSPTPMPNDLPPENSAWTVEKRDELRVEVDRANAVDEKLPRVGARLYAQYQRAQMAIGPAFGEPPASADAADGDWFTQLNTSPAHRIVAGLGTRVVQRDQEQLMQAAWAQVGDVRKANAALVRLQFGRYVAESLHRNHFSKLGLGELTQVLRGVHARVAATGTALTLQGVLARSSAAPAAMTPAFRRLSRVRGPLARFSTAADIAALKQIVAQGQQYRDFRRVYVEPDGIRTLSPGAIASIPAGLVARKLGVAEGVAHATFASQLSARSTVSVADRLAQPVSTWRVPVGTVDLASRGAAAIAAQVDEIMPSNFARESARAESLAPLLVGVANASVPAASARASSAVGRISARLPFSDVPASAGMAVNMTSALRAGAPAAARSNVLANRGAISLAAAVPVAAAAPPQARARFETVASRSITDTLVTSQAVAYADVASSLSQLIAGIGVAGLSSTPDRPALNFTRTALLATVAPAATVTRYAAIRLGNLPSWLPPDWFANGRVAPIMAAPHFDRAMFDALDAYDRDWLIPGLGSIPFTDFVTVLSTNPVFTESFLIGLSDEMGRELLWRGYPTDQRGTYFRRFWNQSTDDLKKDIHRFDATPLGSHLADGGQGRVVLVVRGEVVRRYPDAIFLAMRADTLPDDQGRPRFSANPADTARILFHHHLAPDILLVGFELFPSQIQSEPWWFLITENPSALRFGLDLPDAGNGAAASGVQRNDLDWNDLGPLSHNRFLTTAGRTLTIGDGDDAPAVWPDHAGVVARTLLQNPFRAAFNAHKLITPAV